MEQTCRILPEQQAQQRWLGGSVSGLRSALLQGFDLNKNKISIIHYSLYHLISHKLTNLSCGSVYSFNLIAHNIAGRSKPRWVFFNQEWELKNCKKKRKKKFKMLKTLVGAVSGSFSINLKNGNKNVKAASVKA